VRKILFCWLYSEKILATHGPVNVEEKGPRFFASVIVQAVELGGRSGQYRRWWSLISEIAVEDLGRQFLLENKL
jgi:hypothetical protein